MTTAQATLADATLTATIAGTVASVDLTVGQQVSGSSSSSGSGSRILLVIGRFEHGLERRGVVRWGESRWCRVLGHRRILVLLGVLPASTAQVVVVSTGSYVVNTTVDSTQVGQIKVGDQATITVSGSTTPVYGTVGSIGLLATTTSGVAPSPWSST